MSMKINLNDGWSCSHRIDNHIDQSISYSLKKIIDQLEWFPVELPHLTPVQNESSTETEVQRWWYRKDFQWNFFDQISKESICLTFESSDGNEKNSDPCKKLSIDTQIWFDYLQIFSGLIGTTQTSIDFSQIFLRSEEMKNVNTTHMLLLCCMNSSLPLNIFLTVPSGGIHSIREVYFNRNLPTSLNLNEKKNDICNYVTSINDIEEDENHIFQLSTEKRINEKRKDLRKDSFVPLLNIVMIISGTRGDVQPFIAFGQALRTVGHRVRLATHEKFRNFVRENGLEFYPLNGDPDEIMSFMVENQGIIPSITTVLKGNLFRRRRIFTEILNSSWLSCISDDDQSGLPFRAEAIIANPISYGHIHCAEKLSIPLHMVFTMPSSPTTAFPHPLAKVDYSKTGRERLNLFSYTLVETLMWLGIGDLINKFRRNVLNLPSIHIRQGVSMMIDQKVPYTYTWSPSLVPKPEDWPYYIDICGFLFLDLASSYTRPPSDLLTFLGLSSKGHIEREPVSPPIFIGFGSITGHDSERLLQVIMNALIQTGYRALLSGFDMKTNDLPSNLFLIEDIPFDWLFQHVSAVCHHGGGGTTAAGLRAGKPTIILPFFGDQFFWGDVVEKIGAGPRPIAGKNVTVKELVEALKFVHRSAVREAAERAQQAMSNEDGCAGAVRAFHANLPTGRMRSDLEGTYPACFRLDQFNLQISRPVAQVLLSAGLINQSELRYHCTQHWQLSSNKKRKSNVDDCPFILPRQLNSTTAKSSAYNSEKNDSIGSSTGGNRRRRSSSNVIETLVAELNSTRKPTMSTLSSTAQRNVSKDISVNEVAAIKINDNTSSLLPINMNQTEEEMSDQISILACNASYSSDFSPEVCKDILFQFMKMKRQGVQMKTSSLMTNCQSYPPTVERRHSFTHL